MNGDELPFPELRTSRRFSLLVGGPIEREEAATSIEKDLIDRTEQASRRFHVAVFNRCRGKSSQGFDEPDNVGYVDERAQAIAVVTSRFGEAPLAGRKHPK